MQKYDVEWVKSLCASDLILCNLLTFMRIYKYNLLSNDPDKSIKLDDAEAYGITRITVRLRTKDDKTFTPAPYYVPDDEAQMFKEKLIAYYQDALQKKGVMNV